MGDYLNNSQVHTLYESEIKKPYFVDKTNMLRLLIPLVEQGNNHICITRPRRFGKSVAAAMIGAFFSKGADIKKDVALMVAGEAVPADVEEFAATAMQLTTRNELLSAME